MFITLQLKKNNKNRITTINISLAIRCRCNLKIKNIILLTLTFPRNECQCCQHLPTLFSQNTQVNDRKSTSDNFFVFK